MGSKSFDMFEEESTRLYMMCKCCDATKILAVEYTDAKESGITNLLLPESDVRWLRTSMCPTCYEDLVPKTLQFLSKYADCLPIQIEKEDLPYFNLLFPRRKSKHFRILLNQDEMQVVKNSNLRWKDISK